MLIKLCIYHGLCWHSKDKSGSILHFSYFWWITVEKRLTVNWPHLLFLSSHIRLQRWLTLTSHHDYLILGNQKMYFIFLYNCYPKCCQSEEKNVSFQPKYIKTIQVFQKSPFLPYPVYRIRVNVATIKPSHLHSFFYLSYIHCSLFGVFLIYHLYHVHMKNTCNINFNSHLLKLPKIYRKMLKLPLSLVEWRIQVLQDINM